MINHNKPPLIEPLTERENDVLRLMSTGQTNREIAAEYVISVETVRWYTKQIYSKLGVHSRAQAVVRAHDLRLFEDEDFDTKPTRENVTPRHNLPDYSLSFVGRDKEVDDIRAILCDKGKRLITIAGPGGIGKTRLCIEVARLELHQFTDGVFFVPLSTAASVDDIYPLISKAMNLRVDREHQDRLISFLEEKNTLLILDNFEHLTEGAYQLKKILNETQGVKLMVTSRATLNLREEYSRHLKGVNLSQNTDIESSTAIQLFVDRAQRVRGDFSLEDNLDCVIEICRLVDGMPLAIEMATAWLKSLQCADIAHEISRNIDFLTNRDRDIDERHRSIRAVFDYSWELLTDMEKRMLQRLSMFRGGFGYAAAQQVAGVTPQNLADLIDKSLLYQTSDGLYRFHDLLRQYAERQLESSDAGALSTRSTMISMWASLVRGDFGKVRKIGEGLLERDDSDTSIYEEAFGMALLGVLSGVEGDYEQCKQLCEASHRILYKDGKITDPISTVFTHLGLSIAACGAEDYHAVQHHAFAALDIGKTLQIPAFLTLCLPLAAIVRAHDVEVEKAIECMGLAFNHKASSPAWLEQWSFLTGLRHDLKEEIGDKAFDIVWQRGKDLDLQVVMADILREFASGSKAVRGD